ncbi:MAG: cyclase family protein [Hyphomicrobiaceae bacterium]
MRIIDLTMPITADHIRWPVRQTVRGDLDAGDIAQVTTINLSCHSFTHVDARSHYFSDGSTIDATPLEALVGQTTVLDLMDVVANEPISVAKLEERASRLSEGDRVLLKTGWHRHRPFNTRAFWTDAPYLTRHATEWLLDRRIRTICFDFPQDYVIRRLLDDLPSPISEHVTHDILLRNGVHMVEYLTNTAAISHPQVFLSAAPLKIAQADGAPARVYAIED